MRKLILVTILLLGVNTFAGQGGSGQFEYFYKSYRYFKDIQGERLNFLNSDEASGLYGALKDQGISNPRERMLELVKNIRFDMHDSSKQYIETNRGGLVVTRSLMDKLENDPFAVVGISEGVFDHSKDYDGNVGTLITFRAMQALGVSEKVLPLLSHFYASADGTYSEKFWQCGKRPPNQNFDCIWVTRYQELKTAAEDLGKIVESQSQADLDQLFSAHPVSKDEFAKVLAGLRFNIVGNKFRNNPDGFEEPLIFNFGIDHGTKFIEALNPVVNILDRHISGEPVLSGDVLRYMIHEALHLFGYNEVEAHECSQKAMDKWSMGILQIENGNILN